MRLRCAELSSESDRLQHHRLVVVWPLAGDLVRAGLELERRCHADTEGAAGWRDYLFSDLERPQMRACQPEFDQHGVV